MSTNNKFFSKAIAEARSLKEVALTNAKLSLAESFAPKIQSMISNKLNEMEDDSLDESDDVNLDEILSEFEDDTATDDISSPEFGDDTDEDGVDSIGDDLSDEELIGDEEVGEITVDELKDIIRDVMTDLEGDDDIVDDDFETTDDFETDSADVSDDEEFGLAAENLRPGLEEMTSRPQDGVHSAIAGADNIAAQVQSLISKSPQYASKIKKFLEDLGSGAGIAMRSEAIDELNELKKANKILSETLRDVNLLNSKLLHVNKIFKSKNLQESQKVKVINAFDRASTVRETENIYEALKDSLSTQQPKRFIKENIGLASKAVGTKSWLNESSTQTPNNVSITRMQKLAGLY